MKNMLSLTLFVQYILQGICVAFSRDECLTSDHEISFRSIGMPLFGTTHIAFLEYTDDYFFFLMFTYGHL